MLHLTDYRPGEKNHARKVHKRCIDTWWVKLVQIAAARGWNRWGKKQKRTAANRIPWERVDSARDTAYQCEVGEWSRDANGTVGHIWCQDESTGKVQPWVVIEIRSSDKQISRIRSKNHQSDVRRSSIKVLRIGEITSAAGPKTSRERSWT